MGRVRAWLLCLRLSFRWIPIVNLGDLVWHEGAIWIVTNGVGGWTLHRKSDDLRKEHVPYTDVRKVRKISNYLGSFRRGYRFYMISWFDIWARKGIEPWMRSCRIWATEDYK